MAVTLTSIVPLRGMGVPVRALVARVLRLQGRRAKDLGVRLTDDPELRSLNRQWRGLDRATDVLSFHYEEGEPGWLARPIRGDLVVSLDRTFAQARRFRVTPGRELARLIVHGVLHLCGHDHARPDERRRMRRCETAALRGTRAIERALSASLATWRER